MFFSHAIFWLQLYFVLVLAIFVFKVKMKKKNNFLWFIIKLTFLLNILPFHFLVMKCKFLRKFLMNAGFIQQYQMYESRKLNFTS